MPPHVPHATCNALIRRSIDLRSLYTHAAATCEPGLRLVLEDNAHTLGQLIGDLQAQLGDGGGHPRLRESWLGVMHRHMMAALVRAASRREAAWLRALMHQERNLLQAFEQAIAAAPPGAALALRRQLPRLRGIHLDMHNLAGAPRC